MKLEPLFKVSENKLYKIADNSPVNLEDLKKIQVKWTDVEIEDEAYNEEYLAKLRDQLKAFDEAGIFAILIPVIDKKLETPEQIELFINAYNHTARRVKDCVSVTGLQLPAELLKSGIGNGSSVQNFIDTLNIKHAQYVYFALKNDINTFNLTENISAASIVVY